MQIRQIVRGATVITAFSELPLLSALLYPFRSLIHTMTMEIKREKKSNWEARAEFFVHEAT
jgi:hypothetical protein